jgi:hypothetical protein
LHFDVSAIVIRNDLNGWDISIIAESDSYILRKSVKWLRHIWRIIILTKKISKDY